MLWGLVLFDCFRFYYQLSLRIYLLIKSLMRLNKSLLVICIWTYFHLGLKKYCRWEITSDYKKQNKTKKNVHTLNRTRPFLSSWKMDYLPSFIGHFIFHSSIYLSGRAFMCHFLLSSETSVETMVPLQHFPLFCLCSAKHDGTNEPIKCAGGCAFPGGS